MNLETKIKKANSRLMRHAETRMMAGIFVSGKVEIRDDVPTACTDGWNVRYGRKFMEPLTVPETTGVALHEGLHKFLKHIPRFRKLMKKDGRLINAAMDYAINDFIHNLKDKTLAVLPGEHLYHPMFHNWSVIEIYEYLKTGRDKDGKKRGEPQEKGDGMQIGGQHHPLDSMDQHEVESFDGGEMTEEKAKEIIEKIDSAIQQGAVIAGAMNVELPRAVTELLNPPVDWRQEMYEFTSQHAKGADELTMRKYNRRYVADDRYMPTMYSETVSKVYLLIDTSGSIDQRGLNEWAGAAASMCESVQPEEVHVLWWDTKVHAEQVFTSGQFSQIRELLKPVGGGGTYVSSVNDYINQNKLTGDCAIVLTDGYVEDSPRWNIEMPTLWMVTQNRAFVPPAGRVIKVENLGE